VVDVLRDQRAPLESGHPRRVQAPFCARGRESDGRSHEDLLTGCQTQTILSSPELLNFPATPPSRPALRADNAPWLHLCPTHVPRVRRGTTRVRTPRSGQDGTPGSASPTPRRRNSRCFWDTTARSPVPTRSRRNCMKCCTLRIVRPWPLA